MQDKVRRAGRSASPHHTSRWVATTRRFTTQLICHDLETKQKEDMHAAVAVAVAFAHQRCVLQRAAPNGDRGSGGALAISRPESIAIIVLIVSGRSRPYMVSFGPTAGQGLVSIDYLLLLHAV